MNTSAPNGFLIVVFLGMLAGPPLVQTVVEAWRGEWPRALQVFAQRPTPENLRAYDKSLEDSSVTVRALRPWMQAAVSGAMRFSISGERNIRAMSPTRCTCLGRQL